MFQPCSENYREIESETKQVLTQLRIFRECVVLTHAYCFFISTYTHIYIPTNDDDGCTFSSSIYFAWLAFFPSVLIRIALTVNRFVVHTWPADHILFQSLT